MINIRTMGALAFIGFMTANLMAADDLPRAYGPFPLGMKLSEFRKLTGAPVFGAKSGDTIGTLKSDGLEKFVPAKNRVRERNAGFVFAGKEPDSPLYQIGFTPDETDLDALKINYARFGPHRVVKIEDTDRSGLEWCQNGNVRVLVTYLDKTNRPTSVTIEELKIMGQALADEGASTDRAICGKWP
jgi:hypothetical protein